MDETQNSDSGDDSKTLNLELALNCLDDSHFITLHVRSGSYIWFRVDIGVQSNVLPVEVYKQATGDKTLGQTTPVNT